MRLLRKGRAGWLSNSSDVEDQNERFREFSLTVWLPACFIFLLEEKSESRAQAAMHTWIYTFFAWFHTTTHAHEILSRRIQKGKPESFCEAAEKVKFKAKKVLKCAIHQIVPRTPKLPVWFSFCF